MRKVLWLLGGMFVLMLGVCGCMIHDVRIEKERIEEYLNKKYDDVFTVLRIENSDFLTDYFYAYAIRMGDDDSREFPVKWPKAVTNDSKCEIADAYKTVLIRDALEAEAVRFLKSEGYSSKVFITRSMAPFSDSNLDAFYYVFVKADTAGKSSDNTTCKDTTVPWKKQFVASLERLFQASALQNRCGLFRCYLISSEVFEQVSRDNCTDVLDNYYEADNEKCFAVVRKDVKKLEGYR